MARERIPLRTRLKKKLVWPAEIKKRVCFVLDQEEDWVEEEKTLSPANY